MKTAWLRRLLLGSRDNENGIAQDASVVNPYLFDMNSNLTKSYLLSSVSRVHSLPMQEK